MFKIISKNRNYKRKWITKIVLKKITSFQLLKFVLFYSTYLQIYGWLLLKKKFASIASYIPLEMMPQHVAIIMIQTWMTTIRTTTDGWKCCSNEPTCLTHVPNALTKTARILCLISKVSVGRLKYLSLNSWLVLDTTSIMLSPFIGGIVVQ